MVSLKKAETNNTNENEEDSGWLIASNHKNEDLPAEVFETTAEIDVVLMSKEEGRKSAYDIEK